MSEPFRRRVCSCILFRSILIVAAGGPGLGTNVCRALTLIGNLVLGYGLNAFCLGI